MAQLAVVLVGVEHPGNLGAVARAMKNFGVRDLVLVDPACSPQDAEAQDRAKWANDVLAAASIGSWELLKRFDLVVGTTGQLGSDYNLPRTPLTPGQLAERVAEADAETRVALVFGRESDGLRNEEIGRCDFTVSIPADAGYPTLNLSHAVAILLYELTKKEKGEELQKVFPLVKPAEKRQLKRLIDEALDSMDFPTADKRETQRVLWHRLVGKSFLSQREALALMGFLKRAKRP